MMYLQQAQQVKYFWGKFYKSKFRELILLIQLLTNNNKTENKQGLNINEDLNKKTKVKEALPAWKNIDGKLHYVTEDGIVQETGWFKEKDENH